MNFTKVVGITKLESIGFVRVILLLAVLVGFRLVIDGQTDG